jgi:hypothetical protein
MMMQRLCGLFVAGIVLGGCAHLIRGSMIEAAKAEEATADQCGSIGFELGERTPWEEYALAAIAGGVTVGLWNRSASGARTRR